MADDEDKVLEEEANNWSLPGQNKVDSKPSESDPKPAFGGDFSFHPFANDKKSDDDAKAPIEPKSPFDMDENEDIDDSTAGKSTDTFTVDSVEEPDKDLKKFDTPKIDDLPPKDDTLNLPDSPAPNSPNLPDSSNLKADFDKAASDIKAGIDKMSSILSDLIAKSESLETTNKSLEEDKKKLEEGIAKVKDAFSSL